MRVIAGKARRIQLKTAQGSHTRPTTDRIKETLFNMLQPNLYEAEFLDLFAGSGGIGIEAISRGAENAVFIENDKEAVECIKENLNKTKLETQAEVLFMDVLTGIRKLAGKKVFSIVFIDPPYKEGFEEPVLMELAKNKIIDCDTLIIIEAALDTKLEFLDKAGFEIEREKLYKTNKHFFLRYIGEN